MQNLTGYRVAVIASDGFEESELTEPLKALRGAGAEACVVGPKRGPLQGVKHMQLGAKVEAELGLDELNADDFDAAVLPGGALNADFLRVNDGLKDFLRALDRAKKPIAAICHAPWELASADLLRGRRLTSYHTIEDDLRNAGADWVDDEVVVDGNLVTSRKPDDLPAFNAALLRLFAQARAEGAARPPRGSAAERGATP